MNGLLSLRNEPKWLLACFLGLNWGVSACTGDESVIFKDETDEALEADETDTKQGTDTDTDTDTEGTDDGDTDEDETDDGDTDEGTDEDETGAASDEADETDEDQPSFDPDARLSFQPIPLENDPTFVTDFAFVPNRDEFIALTRYGDVLHYQLRDDVTLLLGSFVVPDIDTETDCGLIGIAFDPDYEDNDAIYISQCFSQQESGVVRYQLNQDNYEATLDTAKEIVRLGYAEATRSIHNVGKIAFDDDGNMYTGFGEKGASSNARNPAIPLGMFARFKPLAAGGYTEPTPPNPDFDGADETGLIYAIGLRSPWTSSVDSKGRYWVGDVGSSGDDSFEEINVISGPGQDFGWKPAEGKCDENCEGFTDPVRSWKRRPTGPFELEDPDVATPNTRVAWVGPEYMETDNDRYEGLLSGRVLYGDMCLGFVRGVQLDDDGEIQDDRHLGHAEGVSAWRIFRNGYLYGISYRRCTHNQGNELPAGRLLKAVLD